MHSRNFLCQLVLTRQWFQANQSYSPAYYSLDPCVLDCTTSHVTPVSIANDPDFRCVCFEGWRSLIYGHVTKMGIVSQCYFERQCTSRSSTCISNHQILEGTLALNSVHAINEGLSPVQLWCWYFRSDPDKQDQHRAMRRWPANALAQKRPTARLSVPSC